MDKLTEARKNINEIDREMAKLFLKRMDASKAVAEYKLENALPVFDAAREAEVVKNASSLIEDDEMRSYYVSFLRNILELSKKYQHRLLDGMKVAYCGVPGAFAHIAAERIFPDGNTVSYPSFRDAYYSVVDGECDAVVLPIENSYNGDVTQVLDLIFFGSLYASGIYDLEVTHNLLAAPGASIGDIKRVLSHPQALAQCASYIEEHGFESVETANTAMAAKEVASSGRHDTAAIASISTAKLYGLTVLEKRINESTNNTTRFIVLTRAKARSSCGGEHFIMFFTVKNEAGSLGRVVKIIGEHGFNLRALKSRPTKELIWEYYFYVESDGNIASPDGQEMISELYDACSSIKIVGNFDREIKLKEE